MKAQRRTRNDPPPPAQPEPGNRRKVATLAMLVVGLLIWLLLGEGRGMGVVRWGIILGAGVLALITPAAKNFGGVADWLNASTPARRQRMTLGIGVVALVYFIVTAFLQERDLFPKTHDECSYAIGAHIIAAGRLWMPQHPLADFFESFYLLTKPAYCSIYFPGTAMLFAIGVWLHLPSYVIPVVCGAAAVAALHALVCELVDETAGLLAAILLISLTWFRTFTILMMAQGPMLLAGLLILIVCMRWLKTPSWKWGLVLGVLIGWAAIIRPVDALAFAIPAVALIIGTETGTQLVIRSKKTSCVPVSRPRRLLKIGLAMLVGAAPFLGLQIAFNMGVCGKPFRTPYTLYLQQYQPGSVFGVRAFEPGVAPKSSLPQIQKDYALSRTYLQRHTPGNFLSPWFRAQTPEGFSPRPAYLAMIADTTLPARWMLLLIPVGLLGLTDKRRLALAAVVPIFIGFYVWNPFFLEHYAIPLIGSITLLVILGMRQIAITFPRLRFALPAMLIATCTTALWEVNHVIERDPSKQVSDEALSSGLLRKAHDTLSGERAIVLFKFDPAGPKQNWKAEPVYNTEVAWPDDAEVIRAHDLGDRDRELIDYYGVHQPERALFIWDPTADEVRRVGTVGQLRQSLQAGASVSAVLGRK